MNPKHLKKMHIAAWSPEARAKRTATFAATLAAKKEARTKAREPTKTPKGNSHDNQAAIDATFGVVLSVIFKAHQSTGIPFEHLTAGVGELLTHQGRRQGRPRSQ